MMTPAAEAAGRPSMDFNLPEACPLCSGEVSIRVTPSSAWCFCPNCRWLTRPQVRAGNEGLQIEFSAGARA